MEYRAIRAESEAALEKFRRETEAMKAGKQTFKSEIADPTSKEVNTISPGTVGETRGGPQRINAYSSAKHWGRPEKDPPGDELTEAEPAELDWAVAMVGKWEEEFRKREHETWMEGESETGALRTHREPTCDGISVAITQSDASRVLSGGNT